MCPMTSRTSHSSQGDVAAHCLSSRPAARSRRSRYSWFSRVSRCALPSTPLVTSTRALMPPPPLVMVPSAQRDLAGCRYRVPVDEQRVPVEIAGPVAHLQRDVVRVFEVDRLCPEVIGDLADRPAGGLEAGPDGVQVVLGTDGDGDVVEDA